MKLLLVEDEPRIQEIVVRGLSQDGFEVDVVSSAELAMEKVASPSFEGEAFLVDILLPRLSGLDLCRWLRDRGQKEPIILLTAKGSVEDKVAGLDAGADDYLTKPFEVAELRARFRALSRKSRGYPKDNLTVADLVLDPNTHIATRGGKKIALSKKEVVLLEYLIKNQNRVVTRAMIANAVWDTDTSQYTNVIDVFINHLRKKIDNSSNGVRLLHTIRSKGFRLTDSLDSGE